MREAILRYGRARTALPFAGVAFAGVLALLLPPYADVPLEIWAGLLGVPVVAAMAAVMARTGLRRGLETAVLLASFVVLAAGRQVSGGSLSAVTPLLLLPVLWIVLYGDQVQLWLSLAATGLLFWLPLLVVGRPLYDMDEWRRGLLWAGLLAVVCPPLQRAVQRMRSAEQRSAELAGQLSSVLRAATDHAVVTFDLAGTVRLFSEGAERMLGHRSADVVGRAGPVAFHLSDEIEARAQDLGVAPGVAVLTAAVPQDGADVRPWTYRRRDGSTLRVRLAITRLRDADGRQVGWTGVASDITAQEQAMTAAAAGEARWRVLLDHLPDTSVLVVDDTLTYRLAVGAGLARQGLDGVTGRTLWETSSPANAALVAPLLRSALAGRVASVELVSTHTGRITEIVAVPLPAVDGQPGPQALSLGRDVTSFRRQQDELRRARDRADRLFDAAPHGKLLLDAHGRVEQVNAAASALLHRPPAELVGRHVDQLPGFAGAAADGFPADLLDGSTARIDVQRTVRRGEPDETTLAVAAVTMTGTTGAVDGILVTVVDVSERKRYEEQLARLADHDPLTGLFNRRRFDEELASHLDRCRRYGGPAGALMMLDLDNFKAVNDTLGHHVGDQLLVSVGDVLRARMRSSDVVARLGGDEFVVLLPRVDRAGAETVARDVVDLIRSEVRVLDGTRPRRVTASVGVVLIEDLGAAPSELLASSDMVMYDAKDAGRDRFVVMDATRFPETRTGARIAWTDRIAHALEDGRFTVHAQPVQDLRSGRIAGAELLVRMVDEDGGLVMPGRFLYIAERTRLITDIDTFMVTRAVQALAVAQQHDPDFSVEVNLSGQSVGNAELADHITEAVLRSGIDPHGLVLEITETAAVSDIEAARAFAERIGSLGCRFALDDFGAGYGSFYYLKHLLFDFIKIDGEFVTKAPGNPTDQLILASIVDIAAGLGKQTIAEFVSDAAVHEVVRRLGVDYAQGYHISPPQPLTALFEQLWPGAGSVSTGPIADGRPPVDGSASIPAQGYAVHPRPPVGRPAADPTRSPSRQSS
ncbi:sensor domain-containing protein [Nakamurella endophytica]|uniref:PAS domain S-box-containing protein/diguanylate cyclase (GGDEF)-like protein n=1 Tax=Nakamurella endophytica TaxID=1748367 RepID=A0A917WNF8_9ACTN|nr:EAL domain-containing protein [Nakamurella endophytica]GGM16994.1 hypothetical protein GCM10011594_41320 [Nakamurella endophytica]